MRSVRRGQILTFLEKPFHLITSLLYASVLTNKTIDLAVFTGYEGCIEVSAVVAATLAILDMALALEALGSSTPNYG
jgi:hypothetical protein